MFAYQCIGKLYIHTCKPRVIVVLVNIRFRIQNLCIKPRSNASEDLSIIHPSNAVSNHHHLAGKGAMNILLLIMLSSATLYNVNMNMNGHPQLQEYIT